MSRYFHSVFVSLFVAIGLSPAAVQAQTGPRLITKSIDESQLQTLRGNTHRLARPEFQTDVAPPDLAMDHMLLVLNRSAAQETDLQTMLVQQQDATSPNYHQWLTPQEFGQRFGASDQDIQTITAWLQSAGFTVNGVANGKNLIDFSGTAAQVEGAFHTQIRKYVVNGQEHWANATDPQIPAALTGAVAGFASLHNFTKVPQGGLTGQTFEAQAGTRPDFTSGTAHALTPGDYATIYNINPLLSVGDNGYGVTITVVARTNINVSDVTSFRSSFGLLPQNPVVVVNGTDPGDVGGGEESEAVLDASWAGAIAPNATVKLVVSKTTNTTDGVDLSEAYIINNNLGDVMTESFGDCETNYTRGNATYYSNLASQAAAEGITYLVAAGDSGAAGCDSPTETSETGGLSVNILAANPYTVAVGGTQFNENGNDTAYWSSTNTSNRTSAYGYIPEMVWNESCTSSTGVNPCTNGNSPGLWAGGGGASAYYSKPSWQNGVPGIPNDGKRDVPDVSLSASGHDAYLLCIRGSCTPNNLGRIQFHGYGGTSAATPSFAGIVALVVQRAGRQGQANSVLYGLASRQSMSACNASSPPASNCIFNDVTAGNNAVPGETGYPTSSSYQAGVGYDLATGLGSVNVTNLVNAWTGSTISSGTPGLSVSAPTLSFAAQIIGLAVTQQVTISNPGTGTLFLKALSVAQSSTDFSNSKSCPTTILAGGSCTLTVTFSPVAPGTRTGTLVISSTNGTLSRSVSLTGTGVATPTATVSVTSLIFGNRKVVTRSAAQTITITNSTASPISTSGLSIAGANPEDFIEANTCPATLATGSSCSVYVIFTPLLSGPRSATLSMPAPNFIQVVSLSGTGTLTGNFEVVNALTGKVLDLMGGSFADGTPIQQNALDGLTQQQWTLTPTSNGYYTVTNVASGRVLDVTAASSASGALIQEWDNFGTANQQWAFVPVDDVHYRIVNRNSGKVLDVVGGSAANGTSIQQYDYLGDGQQLWLLVPTVSYNIGNKDSGDVLDVPGGSSASGTPIQQYSANGGKQQQWQFLPVSGGFYAIMNTQTGEVLDVKGLSTADGAPVQQYDYLNGSNQQWQLQPVDASSYKIINRLSQKALDDTAASLSSGTYMQQWTYVGGINQQWQLTPVNYYTILNRLSGEALDVPGGSTADGTLLQQWGSNGFAQQQWQLVSVAGGAFLIVNNLTGKVLDVQGASALSGALIQESTYTYVPNQQWQFVPIGGQYIYIQNSLSSKVLDVVGVSTASGAAIQQYDALAGLNQQWLLVPVPN